jgi:LPS export ABC transporter protein LptC
MRKTGLTLALGVAAAVTIGSCTEEGKVDISGNIRPDKMPSMTTYKVSTLISDSGVTQYKIVAPVWYVYDEVDTPYWSFPQGLYLQKFDPTFKVIATVAADSAYFYRVQKLWRLEGNVEMTKAPTDLFLSPRVFWDQRRQRLYSDTFIHIENATHVLEGTGFESNERLTEYRILHPTGIFPVDRDKLRASE